MSAVGHNEIRVVVQPSRSAGAPAHAVPAATYKKLFDAVLSALTAADRELHTKNAASSFYIAHLSTNPCEFGVVEIPRARGVRDAPAIALFRRCAGRVYRSDYQILLRHRRLMRAFQRIVAALDPAHVVVVRYHDTELPLDEFFRRQVDRVGLTNEARPLTDVWFAGVAVCSYDGRLEAIDYRGAAWRGRLTLAGTDTQIECVFDKAMGEDALNPFGNKDVSITGRAIYTGDSRLPERVEIMTIEVRPRVCAAIDVRGVLAPEGIRDWRNEFDHFDER